VPLNELCWLGLGGANPGGDAYKQGIVDYVNTLQAAGIWVVLELHVNGPAGETIIQATRAKDLRPLPDVDNSIPFWKDVATTFLANPGVIFDLYNEPHDVDWGCWRDGCTIAPVPKYGRPLYQAAGMQQLVDTIRATGAKQPIMLGGLSYSGDVSQWLSYRPNDPANALIASFHNYEGKEEGHCHPKCWRGVIAPLSTQVPVVAGEFGDVDCNHNYSDKFMRFADRIGISYLAWTWDATSKGWDCSSGPALIKTYRGKPSPYGVGVRKHLLALARRGL
jgi:hypothetical protein